MRIVVVAVGGIRGPLAPAVEEYLVRAGRYWNLEVVEVEAGAPGRKVDPNRVKAAEAERLRSRLPPDGDWWVLTREGKPLTSPDLARLLDDRVLLGGREVALILGGAFGVDESLKVESARRISLGSVTLPHEMARLVVLEQLYRAGTILRNEPYHKGSM